MSSRTDVHAPFRPLRRVSWTRGLPIVSTGPSSHHNRPFRLVNCSCCRECMSPVRCWRTTPLSNKTDLTLYTLPRTLCRSIHWEFRTTRFVLLCVRCCSANFHINSNTLSGPLGGPGLCSWASCLDSDSWDHDTLGHPPRGSSDRCPSLSLESVFEVFRCQSPFPHTPLSRLLSRPVLLTRRDLLKTPCTIFVYFLGFKT